MCGIAGVYLRQGTVREQDLQPAVSALAHRGPDGAGQYIDGPVGLVHTRLAIIDLQQGQQPLYNPDKTLCLVANGEIYNYIELRAELGAKGYEFATHSDCEPLLCAYEEYGEDFLRHVDGMFAIALYDQRRGEVLLARDRLGIKPLFISARADGVYFGSELKSLFCLMRQPPIVNPVGLAQYLQHGFTTGETTLCQGIERVLPGEIVRIGADGVRGRRRYWSLHSVTPQDLSFEEATKNFDALMETVVTQHLRSDVPLGLFLSSGVDSSVLVALLARYGRPPLRTYTVGFPSSAVASELEGAQRLAKRYGAQHISVPLNSQNLLARVARVIWSADELAADDTNLPVSLLSERTSKDVKVVWSGEGGDEVFAGYGYYRRSRIQRWLKQLRVPGSGGFRTKMPFTPVWQRRLYNKTLLQAAAAWHQPFTDRWQETPRRWTDLQRMQYVDIQTWLPDDLLVKLDRMTMEWSLEGRVPYLDHRVVEFGLALPDRLKIDWRSGKLFLRRWAEQALSIPHDHVWRKKSGFAAPIADSLRGVFLDNLQQLLPEQPAIKEWFMPAGVRQLLQDERRLGQTTKLVWRLLQFAIWHRLFAEADGHQPAADESPLSILGAKTNSESTPPGRSKVSLSDDLRVVASGK